MDIALSGEITKHLLVVLKNDTKLARFFAGQFLAGIDQQAMAEYLLTEDLAVALLTKRIVADPEHTWQDLGTLAEGKTAGGGGRRATGRRRRKPTRGTKKSSQPSARPTKSAQKTGQPRLKPAKKISSRRRKPLSPAQAEQLRERVRKFLTKRPWSGRKQLAAAVRFPTEAIYTRIMGELKSEGDVVQRGEKSKTVYALRERSRK